MTDRGEQLSKRNLFDELVALRDRQREWRQGALRLVKSKDVPVELNPWGQIQWYLHPALTDTANRALIVWVMHIPPGGRTGKLRCQGGQIYYVWQGTKGHTVLDGVGHDWAQGCVINLPLKPEGVVAQHFNDGDDTVRLVGSEENLVDALDVDRGSRFEIIEPCPEWLAARPKGVSAAIP
jgi:gentisate 1,2-dioxygenase